MEILDSLKMISFILPLVWLTVILMYFIKNRDIKLKWIKLGIAAILVVYAAMAAYSNIATYSLWKDDPISRYLLPPHQKTYFYEYSLFHFWLSGAVSLTVSLVWGAFLFALKKHSQDRLIDKKEVWLGIFTALSVGWPKFIPYLILFFGILLAIQLYNILIKKKQSAVVVSHSMTASALIVLLLGELFIDKLNLKTLAI